MPMPVVRRQHPDDPASPWLCSNGPGCDRPATTQWPVSCDGTNCPTAGSDATPHAHPMFACEHHPKHDPTDMPAVQ